MGIQGVLKEFQHFFLAGLPDKMFERLEEKQVVNEFRKFPGVITGSVLEQ